MSGTVLEQPQGSVDFALLEQQFTPKSIADVLMSDAIVDVDTIPEFYDERQRARYQAGRILTEREALLIDGHDEQVPALVDILGTARKVGEVKKLYGEDSPEYRESYTGLVLDSERVIGEAERKLTWELFGAAPQKLDPVTETYSAHGVQLPEVVDSGLTPLAGPEERPRRVNEYVEENGTYTPLGRAMKRLGSTALGRTVTSYEFSECTDEAINDLQKNPNGAHGGYVPEIEKFMTREVTFLANGDRIERQLALSGVYITPKVIRTVLGKLGMLKPGENPTKTELHGKQFLDPKSQGVLWVAEQLDLEASQQSGQRIFMGEVVTEDHPMDYEAIPAEAEERRARLAPKPQELSDYLIQLEEKGISNDAAEGILNAYLKRMLLEVARQNPDKAEVMFNKETADGFRVVAALRALGRENEAQSLQTEIEKNAPEVVYCGAGSCGLVAVDPHSREALMAHELGLDGDILHDTERDCPSCQTKGIHYDATGNKACTNCGHNNVGK
jgi:hypothetical protein